MSNGRLLFIQIALEDGVDALVTGRFRIIVVGSAKHGYENLGLERPAALYLPLVRSGRCSRQTSSPRRYAPGESRDLTFVAHSW